MSEKLGRFNPDLPIKEAEKWDFSDTKFSGDDMMPVNVQRREPEVPKRNGYKNTYASKSPVEKAREDTKVGTALGVFGGAAASLAFSGTGIAAPLVLAGVSGAIAHNKLKKEEIRRERAEWNEEYGNIDWLKEFKKQVEEIERKK